MDSPTVHTTARARERTPARGVGRAVLAVLVLLCLFVPASAAAAFDTRTATVKVFFTPEGSECDVVRSVRRTVPMPRVLTGALRQLLAGPTAAERARGLTSVFSEETAGMLRSVAIRDGVAFVDFRDLRPVIPNASTSCGSASLLSQLDATATQFPTVMRARYAINGSEAAFYEWLQRNVPERSRVTRTLGSLDNTRQLHRSGGFGVLREVRTGRHAGFDRVVFEFEGDVPSYWVRYAGVLRSGGGGVPVPMRGTALLEVTLSGVQTSEHEPPYDVTFRGGRRYAPAQRVVRQVTGTGEYEATDHFGIALTGRSGFRVLELDGPSRLAIDVAHDVTVRMLRRGDRGADVRDWQEQLNVVQHGSFAVSPTPLRLRLATDGVFGPRTARATRAFQRAEGVAVDGVVGPHTHLAMRQAIERASAIRP